MQKKVKIVVTVPNDEADSLRRAIGKAGAGIIGEYSYCSFSVLGKGRFLPSNMANPTIGTPGQPEEVVEERIEVTCEENKYKMVVQAIRKAHPYEEPAIDVYPLLPLE